jgi:hypothetical protein
MAGAAAEAEKLRLTIERAAQGDAASQNNLSLTVLLLTTWTLLLISITCL